MAANEKGIEFVTSWVAPYATKRTARDYSLVSRNDEPMEGNAADGDEETSRSLSSSPLSTDRHDPLPPAREDAGRARRLLYLSHTFAQFAEFAWQFGMTIFLAAFANNGSLVLVSTYGFASQMAVLLACPRIGSWMDDPATDRMRAVRVLIGWEFVSICITTICCFKLLRLSSGESYLTNFGQQQRNWTGEGLSQSPVADYDDGSSLVGPESLVLLVMVHLFGSAVRVSDQAFTVFMERDWVIELCRASSVKAVETSFQSEDDPGQPSEPRQTRASVDIIVSTENQEDGFQPSNACSSGSDSDTEFALNLAEMNVTMKQIDLTCKVVGPAMAGFMLPLISSPPTDLKSGPAPSNGLSLACLLVGLLNAAALMVEYLCTARIYYLIPSLSSKPLRNKVSHSVEPTPLRWYSLFTFRELRSYMQQPVAFDGLSLALLYCNGLTFGNGILTTYLLYRHMPVPTIGLLRGLASAVGLLGTCAYRISIKYLTLEWTGLWSIVCECICLGLAYLSLLLGSDASMAALVLLITGICASRIGLWVFDITVTQMQQQRVLDDVRVSVGGVQSALNALFTLASFSIGILFPDPAYFHLYVQCAFFSVALATLTYVYGSRQRRW